MADLSELGKRVSPLASAQRSVELIESPCDTPPADIPAEAPQVVGYPRPSDTPPADIPAAAPQVVGYPRPYDPRPADNPADVRQFVEYRTSGTRPAEIPSGRNSQVIDNVSSHTADYRIEHPSDMRDIFKNQLGGELLHNQWWRFVNVRRE